jgi:hypothetical protein
VRVGRGLVERDELRVDGSQVEEKKCWRRNVPGIREDKVASGQACSVMRARVGRAVNDVKPGCWYGNAHHCGRDAGHTSTVDL